VRNIYIKKNKQVIQGQEVEEENKKYVHFMNEPDIKTSDSTVPHSQTL